MGKYNDLKILRKVKARTRHVCSKCNSSINKDDFYYAEQLSDKFLHSLKRKKFCIKCYAEFGDKLLKEKTSFQKKSQSLETGNQTKLTSFISNQVEAKTR